MRWLSAARVNGGEGWGISGSLTQPKIYAIATKKLAKIRRSVKDKDGLLKGRETLGNAPSTSFEEQPCGL
jgi:hypothetical protein